jgi:hypothetical protein
MKQSNRLKSGLLALCVSLSTIACSAQRVGLGASSADSRLASKGNGDSYAGKTYNYSIPSLCSDGSNVSSRIVVTADVKLILVRDNCTDLNPPVVLDRGQVDLPNDGLSLIYDNRVYVENPPVTAVHPLIHCEGQGNSVAISDSFALKIDTSTQTVSGSLSLRGQVWDFNNQPLRDLGFANPGDPAHEYYMDQGDGTGKLTGFKMIVDLNDNAPQISIIDFWTPDAEFMNASCARY